MARQEVLILAMTDMLSGICVAGFTHERDPVTRLRWVRPTREFDTVLPGDMTDASGRLMQCGDVVELNLLRPRPDPPHVEDWLLVVGVHSFPDYGIAVDRDSLSILIVLFTAARNAGLDPS